MTGTCTKVLNILGPNVIAMDDLSSRILYPPTGRNLPKRQKYEKIYLPAPYNPHGKTILKRPENPPRDDTP